MIIFLKHIQVLGKRNLLLYENILNGYSSFKFLRQKIAITDGKNLIRILYIFEFKSQFEVMVL